MIDWSTPRMRLFSAAATFGVLATVLAMMPWRVGDGALRQEAERRIRAALNAPDASIGAMNLSLLPTPRIGIDGLSFARADGTSGTMKSAMVELKLRPRLRGIAKPTGLTLVSPDITLRLPGEGASLPDRAEAIRAALVATLTESASLNGLKDLSVDGGVLRIVDAEGTDRLDDLRLQARLASPSHPLRINASGQRAGGEVRLQFTGASPQALASGAREPLHVSYASPALTLDFRGKGSLSREIAASGDLTLRAPQGSVLAPFAALKPLGVDDFGALTLQASIEVAQKNAALSGLTIGAGGKRFEGVGAVRHEAGRFNINATLATSAIDLSPMAHRLRLARQRDGGWNDARIDLTSLFGLNLDLRLSSDQASIDGHVLSRAGMSVSTRANRLELSLNDAIYQGGRAKSRLTVTRASDALEGRLVATFDNIDLGGATAAAKLPPRIDGQSSGEVHLESTGVTAAQLIANLDGRMAMSVRGGELNGIDLNRLATRRTGRPDVMLTEALGGKTAFESATLAMKIRHGQASPVEGRMQNSRLVGSMSGEIDLAADAIDLAGSVVQIPMEAGIAEPTPVVDFSVSGPLMAPRVTPNIASLLKRS